MSIDAMKQALAVLAFYYGQHGYELDAKVIIALRTAIKHAERPQTHSEECWRWHHQCAVTKIERMQAQEPVAWANSSDLQNFDMKVRTGPDLHHTVPLYTAPRQWQGLTEEEIWACNVASAGHHVECHICLEHQNVLDFAEAIEAKLKEKNT